MNKPFPRFFGLLPVVIAIIAAAFWWQGQQVETTFTGLAFGNGRLEATEIDVATKLQGRVAQIAVNEGDMVEEGQVVARMDTQVLNAQLREAEAQKLKMEQEKNVAEAVIAQRESEYTFAQQVLKRTQKLADAGVTDQNQLDHDRAAERAAKAIWTAAKAQAVSAEAAIESAKATIERIQADINDSILKSPRYGRVQYRLAEPGEVLAAGGKILTLVDITDVYMTFYLPTKDAGKLAIGAEARIVLDAIPDRAIPAKISFVSPTAQFTPKEVETKNEREKLMFRVKVKIDPVLLRQNADRVKTGLPGMAYVKVDLATEWPASLRGNVSVTSTNSPP
jgi:HlyD family secretion protein